MDNSLEEVVKACNKYGFSYHEVINGIFIRTGSIAGWFIKMTDNKPKLFHENYRHIDRYGNKIMEKYHEHTDIEEDTARGMVDYIMIHDKAMMHRKRKRF